MPLETDLLQRAIIATEQHGSTILHGHALDLAREVVRLRGQIAHWRDHADACKADVARICSVLDAPGNARKPVSELYEVLWSAYAAR